MDTAAEQHTETMDVTQIVMDVDGKFPKKLVIKSQGGAEEEFRIIKIGSGSICLNKEDVSALLGKPYLNEKEVAVITGRALSTIRTDRHMRRGIPYLKITAKSVRYKTQDVLSYMESRRVTFD
mgnify:CR=1 FL=1